MVSSPTSSLRLEKIGTGDQTNTWGVSLDSMIDRLDVSIAGFEQIAVAANVTLTSNYYVADQSRYAAIQFTGAGGFTVTVPNVAKLYVLWNAATAAVTVSNGTTSVVVQPAEVVHVVTDGSSNFSKIDSQVWTSIMNAGGYRLKNLGAPTTTGDAATKDYVDATAFSSAGGTLPAQTGNALKFVRTDGTTASWQYQGIYGINAQTSTYTVVASDTLKLISCTGTFTLSLTAAATLTTYHSCLIKNAGTGNITLAPLSGTVDGLSSYIMYPGEVRQIFNDGTNFQTIVINPFYKVWTATDAGFVWPPGYQLLEYLGWGAGGGGQAGTASAYGAGGGGGGAFPGVISSAVYTPGATATITIGAGGAGGATSGANGSAGGNSTVSSIVTFYGGKGAGGGVGGGGGGFTQATGQDTGFGGASGGGGFTQATGQDTGFGGASGGVSSGGRGNVSAYGGAGGAGGTAGTFAGGASIYGSGGGGTGNGGAGGTSVFAGAGGAGTTTDAGADGSAPAGGGGGGGTNGGTFKAGGAGARGEVRMWGII